MARRKRWFLCSVASVAALYAGAVELRFHWAKRQVLAAPADQLATLGRHFIVPCESLEQVRPLVLQCAAGGIFLRPAFVRGRTAEAIATDIQALQSARAAAGLPHLFVTADQEGGIVSRLSPPLPHRPSLSEIVAAQTTQDAKAAAVAAFATAQGAELVKMGVNVNFAPVLDLNHGVQGGVDHFSFIHRRAISADPAEVATLGEIYCASLAAQGVLATAKHFPGIGRLAGDTHLAAAALQTPLAELERAVWVPFRAVMRNTGAWLMISHASLDCVDPGVPSSLSKPVVHQLLRRQWSCESVIVTDDICMGAVSEPAQAGVRALNAGVDLVLIALDGDLYFSCVAALLEAHREGRLDPTLLDDSKERLARQPK